jgi:cephalosporin-C deacetylase-like acetyl esterase
LSALSGISELEANTKRLIEDQKTNSNGFYLVRLFVNSVWRYIAVDSTLPHVNGENAGVLGNVEGGELDIYSSLIEKAYAKSFSGYDVFSKTHPR